MSGFGAKFLVACVSSFLASSALAEVTSGNWPAGPEQTVPGGQAEYPLMGHNVSPTSYVLHRNRGSIGFYALAYGIDDHWTVATSPWLLVFYNMPSLGLKFSQPSPNADTDFFSRGSFEAIYFKTAPSILGGWEAYKQEAIFLRTVGTHKVTPTYSIHANASFQYYFDERQPFSIRFPTLNQDPWGLNLGLLHEFHFSRVIALQVESAVMNVNDILPVYQVGVSAVFKGNGGFFQLGVSLSHRPGAPYTREQLEDGTGVPQVWLDSFRELQSLDPKNMLHPEMQIQVFL